ncbi:MAG: hypothetical protein RLZZ387_3095 [Chloroflexota bacterium]
MGFSALFPEGLWLLLLVPLLWLMALRLPRRLEGWRLWGSLGLRSALIICLVMAIAGTQLRLPTDMVTTVFLMDTSDSVRPEQRQRAERFIGDAMAVMRPDDRAAVVTFGQDALISRTMDGGQMSYGGLITPGGLATNIQSALQLGMALLPAEGHRRLVLLSDGVETAGNAMEMARRVAAQGIPVDVVPLGAPAEALDAQVSAVELPEVARAGQRLRMRALLESTQAAPAVLVVRDGDDEVLVRQMVALREGSQAVEIDLPEAGPAFNRYSVELELLGDTRLENNAAEAFTVVDERPRVLLVAEAPAEAQHLERALAAAKVGAETVTPADMPRQLDGLAIYDAVVLVNVPRYAVPEESVEALTRFVRDLGHGLMMVGGPSSFGAGGWRNSPLEDVLPVTMDVRTQVEQPPASVVVLVDISGSMSEVENGRTKLSLAVEGAQRIAELLRDEDELVVIPFDHEPVNVVGPIAGRDRAQAVEALKRVTLGGGGINIRDGLHEAARYMRASDRPVRHIITLTDGDDTAQQEGALQVVARLREEGVTLSSIAIGDGDHIEFIQSMPETGDGRYFFTDEAANLPTILVNEAQEVMQPYMVEAPFTPELAAPSPIVRGLDAAPELRGFVQTTARQTAQVILATPDGQPLLAGWQHGLGHTLAWTSDLTERWAADWVRAGFFPELAGQMVSSLLPPPGSRQLGVRAETRGSDLVLRAEAHDALGATKSGMRVAAQLVSASGITRTVMLNEVGAGVYEAVDQPPAGTYEVRLVATDAGGTPVDALTTGAVVSRGDEYRRSSDGGLLRSLAAVTGGAVDPTPDTSFVPVGGRGGAPRDLGLALLWAALALLPLDVALRRQVLERESMAALARKLGWERLAQRIEEMPKVPAAAVPQGDPTTTPHLVPVPVELEERRRRYDEAA